MAERPQVSAQVSSAMLELVDRRARYMDCSHSDVVREALAALFGLPKPVAQTRYGKRGTRAPVTHRTRMTPRRYV